MARINNERSLKDYGELTEIGRGGFGVVYSATRLSDGQKVAIKKISGKVAPERLRNELRAIRSMRHPNIVAFYEDFVENGETCVVMELCPDGSIRDYVRKNGELSKAAAVYILRQLISAVKYIHHENMLHRDLSSGNILIKNIFSKEKIKVKLCDFGLATQLRHGETACTVVGTPGFIAPQVFGQKYDRAADVFSLGGVLYTMLTGRDPPQQGRPRLHGLDDDAADLIERMMHPDSKQRIELADIQNSDFVRNTGDSGLSRDWSVDRRSSADHRFSVDRRGRRGESRERGGGDRWSGQVSRDFSRGTSWTRDRDRSEKRFSMDRAASGSTARQRRAQSQPPREMDYERRAGGERRGGQSEEDGGASSVRGRSVRERKGERARGGAGGGGDDMPWPLRLERIHGNTMVNAYGRFLMMSDRAAKFEMTNTRSRCVDRVLHVITDGGERQKVMISRPISELRPRAQADPPIPNDVLAVGDTCISASQLSAVDAAAYRRLAQAVAWFRGRTAKIAWNRPPQFPDATAKLFENGDVRVTFFDTRTLVQKAGQSEVTGGEKNNRVAVTGETLDRFSDLVRCLRHHADCPGKWTAYPITISSAREGGAGGGIGSPQVLASRQSAASSMLTQRSAPSVLATRQNSLRTTSSGYASGEGREMERRDERSSRSSRDKENRGVAGKGEYSLRKNAAGQVCSVTSQSDGTMMRRSGSYPGIYIYVSGGKETRFRYNGPADSKKVPEAGRHLLEVLLQEIGES